MTCFTSCVRRQIYWYHQVSSGAIDFVTGDFFESELTQQKLDRSRNSKFHTFTLIFSPFPLNTDLFVYNSTPLVQVAVSIIHTESSTSMHNFIFEEILHHERNPIGFQKKSGMKQKTLISLSGVHRTNFKSQLVVKVWCYHYTCLDLNIIWLVPLTHFTRNAAILLSKKKKWYASH